MNRHQHSLDSTHDFIRHHDDLAAGCDPAFDTAYEELEREFAELRLQSSRDA